MDRNGTNEHHIWYFRRLYKSEFEKNLRYHRGFVIPINVLDHRDLHANLFMGPPKPNKPQIYGLLQSIGEFALEEGARTAYVERAVDFFNGHADNPSHMGDNALEIASHLEQQLIYIRGQQDGAGEICWRKSA